MLPGWEFGLGTIRCELMVVGHVVRKKVGRRFKLRVVVSEGPS